MGVCGNINDINGKNTKKRKKNRNKNRVNEVEIEGSEFIKIDKNIINASPSVCKIKILNRKGTGFLIKIKNSNQEELYYLMTNEHVITNKIVKSKLNMQISYDYDSKEKKIDLNKDKRFIKDFKDIDIDIDIIVIQILEEDNIDKRFFLSPCMDKISSNLVGKRIYIIQFPKGKGFCYSIGNLIKIENYEIIHNAGTDKGSSGSPIFLENTMEVIGIHKQGSLDKPENYGNFLYPIIEFIKSNNKNEYNQKEEIEIYKKEINGKCNYKKDEYYKGERSKGLKHGKGTLYYKNGNIKYEGDFIKDKFEGDGKFFWKDGEYYIGQFLNGFMHGKGTLYYKNGSIKYEGDFIKDKYEGDGRCNFENGEYYIGHFLNNQKDGKGTIFYKNGNIKYEGNFKENKKEGKGKFIWENGEYYIGQFLNSQCHGKGTEYYKDGNIKYDGDFIKDKHEGNGKYFWEDGEFYNGQYLNGLRNGKGKLYYKNGHIKYEGDFIDDKFEGNGRYNYENGDYYIGEWSNNERNGKGILYDKNGNIKNEGEFINDKFNK